MEHYLRRSMDYLPQTQQEVKQFIIDHKWHLLALAATSYILHKLNKQRHLPPGPYGLPLLGSIHRAGGLGTGELQEQMKQYGDIASIQLGSELHVFLNTTESAKEAYVNQASVFSSRPPDYVFSLYEFKDEIFTPPYNEEWKKNKKFLTSSLKTSGFGSSSYESKLLTEAEALIKHLVKVQEKAGEEGVTLDEPLTWTAGNLISQIIFNQRYEADDEEFKQLAKMSAFFLEPEQEILWGGLEYFPLWLCKIFYKKTVNKMLARLGDMRGFLRMKIDEHIASMTPGEPRDFMDIYLNARYSPGFDYEVMIDNIIMFLPDAMQTLPLTLEWLILHIVQHPECQKRIQRELDEVVGSSREPSLRDRPHLHYLEATIQESLRVVRGPFVMLPARTPNKDAQIKGYTVPKGSFVYFNQNVAHRNPSKFKDPEMFKPERFLDKDGKFISSTDVIPFSIGPRACVGQSLSKMEFFLLTANLFRALEIRFHPDYDASTFNGHVVGFSYRPKPYSLSIKRR